jgi:hypothetical protein
VLKVTPLPGIEFIWYYVQHADRVAQNLVLVADMVYTLL